MQAALQLSAEVFTGATLTDESQYPCYHLTLSAEMVNNLFERGVIDLDPSYQRGTTPATSRKPALPVHASHRNSQHIEAIRTDLVTYTSLAATPRSVAIIPPIWMNARRLPGNIPILVPAENGELYLTGTKRCYVVDGWHRILAIRRALKDQQLPLNRMFSFYLFDAPLELEARAFRVLNSLALPVERTRVAWVSSPFSGDFYQAAYEFVTTNHHLTLGSERNLETVKATVPRSSGALTTFLTIANGFVAPVSGTKLPWGELDPGVESDRKLLIDFMSTYWDTIVTVRPEFGWVDIAERKALREQLPLIGSPQTIQALLWLGATYLQSYQARKPGATLREKLKELLISPATLKKLLGSLDRLRSLPTRLDFFDPSQPYWKPLVNSHGRFLKNDFKYRRDVYMVLRRELGLEPKGDDRRVTDEVTTK